LPEIAVTIYPLYSLSATGYIAGRGWVGLLKLQGKAISGFQGWGAPKFRKNYFYNEIYGNVI
jgi:hypothetical protein